MMKTTIDIKKYYPDVNLKIDGDLRLVSQFIQEDVGINFDELSGIYFNQYVSNVDEIESLKSKIKVYENALQNIKKHFELMGASICQNSTTYHITTKALEDIK